MAYPFRGEAGSPRPIWVIKKEHALPKGSFSKEMDLGKVMMTAVHLCGPRISNYEHALPERIVQQEMDLEGKTPISS